MIDKVLKAVSKKWGFVISLNKTHMSLDGEEIKDIWVMYRFEKKASRKDAKKRKEYNKSLQLCKLCPAIAG